MIAGLFFLNITPAHAQRGMGNIGIGAQFGEPSGLSLKFYNPGRASADVMASWDFEDYLFVNTHAIYERHLNDRGTMHFYYGPGGFIELQDRPESQEDDVDAGISAKLGLGFMLIDNIELFGHVTPRLQLTPATDGEMGGGIGLRVYL